VASEKGRFWEKVKLAAKGVCWERQAGLDKKNGYGKFGVPGGWDRAHRVAWRLVHGEIPKGMFVLHECDNPKCVNPNHLYLGTKKDNAQDRERRGRGNHAVGLRYGRHTHPGQTRGAKNGRAKLDEHGVQELLRRHFKQGVTKAELAREYSLSKTTVGHIVSGKLWPHVERG
jgi:hypothetical protein